MPLTKRTVFDTKSFTSVDQFQDFLEQSVENDLQAHTFARMMGTMRQLTVLSNYAVEIFANLTTLTEEVNEKTKQVARRSELTMKKLIDIEKGMRTIAIQPDLTVKSYRQRYLKHRLVPSMTTPPLFIKQTNAIAIQQQYRLSCRTPPQLWRIEHMINHDCFRYYSFPGLFFQTWLRNEIIRQELVKEAKRQEKRDKKILKKEKQLKYKLKQLSYGESRDGRGTSLGRRARVIGKQVPDHDLDEPQDEFEEEEMVLSGNEREQQEENKHYDRDEEEDEVVEEDGEEEEKEKEKEKKKKGGIGAVFGFLKRDKDKDAKKEKEKEKEKSKDKGKKDKGGDRDSDDGTVDSVNPIVARRLSNATDPNAGSSPVPPPRPPPPSKAKSGNTLSRADTKSLRILKSMQTVEEDDDNEEQEEEVERVKPPPPRPPPPTSMFSSTFGSKPQPPPPPPRQQSQPSYGGDYEGESVYSDVQGVNTTTSASAADLFTMSLNTAVVNKTSKKKMATSKQLAKFQSKSATTSAGDKDNKRSSARLSTRTSSTAATGMTSTTTSSSVTGKLSRGNSKNANISSLSMDSHVNSHRTSSNTNNLLLLNQKKHQPTSLFTDTTANTAANRRSVALSSTPFATSSSTGVTGGHVSSGDHDDEGSIDLRTRPSTVTFAMSTGERDGDEVTIDDEDQSVNSIDNKRASILAVNLVELLQQQQEDDEGDDKRQEDLLFSIVADVFPTAAANAAAGIVTGNHHDDQQSVSLLDELEGEPEPTSEMGDSMLDDPEDEEEEEEEDFDEEEMTLDELDEDVPPNDEESVPPPTDDDSSLPPPSSVRESSMSQPPPSDEFDEDELPPPSMSSSVPPPLDDDDEPELSEPPMSFAESEPPMSESLSVRPSVDSLPPPPPKRQSTSIRTSTTAISSNRQSISRASIRKSVSRSATNSGPNAATAIRPPPPPPPKSALGMNILQELRSNTTSTALKPAQVPQERVVDLRSGLLSAIKQGGAKLKTVEPPPIASGPAKKPAGGLNSFMVSSI